MDQECVLPLICNVEWSGMFSGIFRNMCGIFMECLGMFSGMFRNMCGLFMECSGMFSGMFGYQELYAFTSSHP